VSEQLLEKLPFERDGKTYEVWIYRDAQNWEYRVVIRLDGCPIAVEGADEYWARMAYIVSVEQEIDAKMDGLPSLLLSAIEVAKSDLDKPHRKVGSNG
jgi:hypothetical protein|tara:strand:+ start:243 stop:536 length:294 start_codon:yes stop_codon:yes gene_type:complete